MEYTQHRDGDCAADCIDPARREISSPDARAESRMRNSQCTTANAADITIISDGRAASNGAPPVEVVGAVSVLSAPPGPVVD